MPTTTAQNLANAAFGILGVYSPSETVSSADASYALGALNDLLSEWSQRSSHIPFVARERFDLVANQGGPTTPYTIGSGGNFNTDRPSNQQSILGANLILTATSPEVRVPLGLMTDDAYFSNPLPGTTSTQPTGLYYNPTYASGLGAIYLWPVPTSSTNDLELLLEKSVAQFANLSTSYQLPDGLPRALQYNLAVALEPLYPGYLTPTARQIAVSSLGVFTRSNLKLTDLANDATFSGRRRTLYNINTGAGG